MTEQQNIHVSLFAYWGTTTLTIKTDTRNPSKVTVGMLEKALADITPIVANKVTSLKFINCDFCDIHPQKYNMGRKFPMLDDLSLEDCFSGQVSLITFDGAPNLARLSIKYSDTTKVNGNNERYFDLVQYGLLNLRSLVLERCNDHVFFGDQITFNSVAVYSSFHSHTLRRIFDSGKHSIKTLALGNIVDLNNDDQKVMLPSTLDLLIYKSRTFDVWNQLDFVNCAHALSGVTITVFGKFLTYDLIPTLPTQSAVFHLELTSYNPVMYRFLEKNKLSLTHLTSLTLKIPYSDEFPHDKNDIFGDIIPLTVTDLSIKDCSHIRSIMPLIKSWHQRKGLKDLELDDSIHSMIPRKELFLARLLFTATRQRFMWTVIHSLSNPNVLVNNRPRGATRVPVELLRDSLPKLLGHDVIDREALEHPDWVAEYLSLIKNDEEVMLNVAINEIERDIERDATHMQMRVEEEYDGVYGEEDED